MTVGRTKAQGARHEKLVKNHSYVATGLSTIQPTPITRLPQSKRPICSQRTSHAVTACKSLPYANDKKTNTSTKSLHQRNISCWACNIANRMCQQTTLQNRCIIVVCMQNHYTANVASVGGGGGGYFCGRIQTALQHW